jgi:hypothetical protein
MKCECGCPMGDHYYNRDRCTGCVCLEFRQAETANTRFLRELEAKVKR